MTTTITNEGIGIGPVDSTIDGPNSPSIAIFKDPAMEAAVRKGKMTLKSVLTEFAEWTGIPGPIQLVYALNTFTRVLWLLIWLVAFAIFAYEVVLIVNQYFQFPAQIKDSLQFEAKRFPVLTICNQNPYKLSIVRTNPQFSSIRTLMDDFLISAQNDYANISIDHFGINKANSRFKKERFARRALMILAAQIPESIRRLATYTFDEFVAFCFFNNVPCGKSNFTTFLDPIYGACFQFNMPNHSDFYSFRPGNNAGLRLLLRIFKTDPLNGEQLYLPTTMGAGIRIAVEMGNVSPAMDDTGLSIGVGREEMVTMENTKTKLLKEPYGICRDGVEDGGVLNYYPNFTYTIQSCLRSCRQNRVVHKCGCADPRFAKPENASFCRIQDVFCLLQLDSEAQSTDQFSPIRDCGCRPACQSQRVDLMNTQGRAFNFICQNGNIAPQLLHPFALPNLVIPSPMPHCSQWYKQNALILSVWFDGMDYIQHEQQSAYTIVRASNDLGGQMGLWLGVCFISLFEILTLLVMIFLYFTRGRKVRVVPTEREKMRDHRYKNIQELRHELDVHEKVDDQIKRKIDKQRRERRMKMWQAEIDLARAQQIEAETTKRAAEMAELAEINPDDTKLRADAANAAALAHGSRLRIQKLKELVAIYSI